MTIKEWGAFCLKKNLIVTLTTSILLAGPLMSLTQADASQESEDATSQEEKSFEKEKAELEETISDTQATIDDLVVDISSQEAQSDDAKEEIEQTQKEIAQLEEQMKQRNEKLVTKARSNKNEVKSSTTQFEKMRDENNSTPSDQYIKLAQLGDQKILDRVEEQVNRQLEELKSVEAELEASRTDLMSLQTDLDDKFVQIAEKYELSEEERKSFINEQTITAERTSNLNEEMKAEKQRIFEEEDEKQEAKRLAEEKREKEAEAKAKAKAEALAKKEAKAEAERKAKAAKAEEAEVSTSSSNASADSGWTRPARGKITSPFGQRTHPVTGEKGSFHSGVDIAGSGSVISSRAGTVTSASYSGTYGHTVIVDHGGGYSTLYAHLKPNLSVSTGQKVSQGQQLGVMGSTGRSTGVHLHFEVRKGGESVNPMNYIK